MRHDCLPWTCGGYHPELRPAPQESGLPRHGTVPARARRRAASKRARAARRGAR